MSRDTYEIYYYQNGRWQLHASYESDQREDAVAEAMNVEGKLNLPARVVRETFFPETNTSEETITWQGNKGKKIDDGGNMFGNRPKDAPKPQAKRAPPPPPPPPPRPEPKKPAPRPAAKPVPPPQKKKKAPKKKGVIARLFTSVLVSGGYAIGSGVAMALGISGLLQASMIPQTDYTPLIVGTPVTIFFLSLLLSLNRQFSLLGMALRTDDRPPAPRAAAPVPMVQRRPAAAVPATQDVEFDHVEIERGEVEVEAIDEVEGEVDAEEAEPPSLDTDFQTEMAAPEPEQPAPAAPAPQQQAPVPQPAHQPAPQQVQPVQQQPQPQPRPATPEKRAPEVSPGETEARQIFASFVTDAKGAVQREVGELNTFSRFGFSLLMAGALSTLGQTKRLAREPQLAILKQGLTAIGNTPDRTDTFCAELPGYYKNARYTGMIQSGSKAMTDFIGGNPASVSSFGDLLADWTKPEKRAATPSVYTFMFTDIVGSTAMTQQVGNANAQKIVRAHNTAVRNALAKYKGREVKHTGDGIMAVFNDSPNAVHATIQMLRDIAAHNASNPNLPLTVRIGLNAGEAVEEENDFFGAAVQMSARVCSKAADGNVWVSQSVVDACKGQRLGFIPRGRFEMKGIQGARTLYEVGWTEKHKNELADL
ncbi:MAG: adenylate/guanylate cyclase domain-containing protein [Rhodospirillaceae bacterium]|nr:adenylate/guanylate cyclase domain-containing protein [Rhodospirillaceae bacterium]